MDQSRRLPVFCRAADWHAADNEPLIEWLDRSTPLLQTSELEEVLRSGKITLFIDGLDELGARVEQDKEGKKELVDPRLDLICRIPPEASVLVTTRSEVLEGMHFPPDFELVEMEALTDDQIASYVSYVPKVGQLLSRDEDLRHMIQTPLTLGLLAFVVSHQAVVMEEGQEIAKLSPRLRLIYHFTISRWQHENLKAGDLLQAKTVIAVLGRLATWGGRFTKQDIEKAAKVDEVNGASVFRLAIDLGLIRRLDGNTYDFFHPLFADCYATIHCWKYLGMQVYDGWDSRLFSRIEQLNDSTFVPALTNMTTGFWRGEFGDEVAMALGALGDANDTDTVQALLRLAPYIGLGHGGWIHKFVERGDNDVRKRFVRTLKNAAPENIEAIHQLVGLGENGIAALVEVYYSLDPSDPMRGQIASYSVVREHL